jgi:hypothetical protein
MFQDNANPDLKCRADNITSFAYCTAGDGSTAPEQYMVFHDYDITDVEPIQDNQNLFLKSAQTGMFCQ